MSLLNAADGSTHDLVDGFHGESRLLS